MYQENCAADVVTGLRTKCLHVVVVGVEIVACLRWLVVEKLIPVPSLWVEVYRMSVCRVLMSFSDLSIPIRDAVWEINVDHDVSVRTSQFVLERNAHSYFHTASTP